MFKNIVNLDVQHSLVAQYRTLTVNAIFERITCLSTGIHVGLVTGRLCAGDNISTVELKCWIEWG